jgi:hypothetical protein
MTARKALDLPASLSPMSAPTGLTAAMVPEDLPNDMKSLM